MLKDRGYTVSDLELTHSLSDFLSAYGHKPDLDRLRICASLRSNPSKKKAKHGWHVKSDRQQRKLTPGDVNLAKQNEPPCWKLADEYSVKVETFHITDLLANITKHVLMPKFEILTVGEKQKLLKKYNVEDKQMPRMPENDAISKYYGLEKGQVVKVTHNGALTDSLVSYRCVT
ncbi:hypothetical protein C3L33_02084, partial [Rhododendron williamsianum]